MCSNNHRDRFNILLGKTVDLKEVDTTQTNLKYHRIGGWIGKELS
jgi:hypothetical protein